MANNKYKLLKNYLVLAILSHANTGHSKEMVPNYFCGNILAYMYKNLKLRPISELLGQIKDFITFPNLLSPQKGLKSGNIRKVSM